MRRPNFARLLTDDAGVTHSISIPPPLIRKEPIAAMRAAAERLLAPQFRAIVRLIDEPLLQPIYDLASPQLAFGRVALIGDAAFVARPHVGAGVSKAADDAASLAKALDADDIAADCVSSKRNGFRSAIGSSSGRGTSVPICRQRRRQKNAHARRATAFPKRCWPKPRWSISCIAEAKLSQ